MRIGYVASEVTRHGGIAICAAIAPYEAARARNRARIGKIGAYIEVYVSTPLSTCVERDPKGLYRKALSGGLKGSHRHRRPVRGTPNCRNNYRYQRDIG